MKSQFIVLDTKEKEIVGTWHTPGEYAKHFANNSEADANGDVPDSYEAIFIDGYAPIYYDWEMLNEACGFDPGDAFYASYFAGVKCDEARGK